VKQIVNKRVTLQLCRGDAVKWSKHVTAQPIELQNLRHLIGAHDTAIQKMSAYAQQAKDPQVRSYFEKSAQSAQKTKQQLLSFLS
jgi:type III secretory pathway component EscR